MNLYKRCENMIEKDGELEQCDNTCYGSIIDRRECAGMFNVFTIKYTCSKCGNTWEEEENE